MDCTIKLGNKAKDFKVFKDSKVCLFFQQCKQIQSYNNIIQINLSTFIEETIVDINNNSITHDNFMQGLLFAIRSIDKNSFQSASILEKIHQATFVLAWAQKSSLKWFSSDLDIGWLASILYGRHYSLDDSWRTSLFEFSSHFKTHDFVRIFDLCIRHQYYSRMYVLFDKAKSKLGAIEYDTFIKDCKCITTRKFLDPRGVLFAMSFLESSSTQQSVSEKSLNKNIFENKQLNQYFNSILVF